MLTTIFSFILVLGVLVFFHELGHYLAARRNGIEVLEFGMGYPPRAAKLFTFQGTEFTLNWIPFGGFARMKGEDASDMSPGSFNAAGAGGRAITLLAGPAMNFVLAILFFAASYLAGFPAPAAYPRLLDVPADSIAARAGLMDGDILLSLDGAPFRVPAISSLATANNNADANPPVGFDGVLKISRGEAILSLEMPTDPNQRQLLTGVAVQYVLDTSIHSVGDESPAQVAGIEVGDRVYALNEQIITPDTPLAELTRQYLGQKVTLTVLRGDAWLTIPATLRADPKPNEGALGVGIEYATSLATMPIGQALWEGAVATADYASFMVTLPVALLRGDAPMEQAEITGPVGIAQMVGGAVSATVATGLWFPIWRLAAILSAALAITNLLPIPALDGGRLLFIVVEVLRGRRINPEREGLIHMIGFALLLGLMVLITFRDLNTTRETVDWMRILGQ